MIGLSQLFAIIKGTTGSGPTLSEEFALDSQNIWDLRIEDFVQRAGPSSIGNLSGKVFGHGTYDGVTTAFTKVEMSTIGSSGPWSEKTALSSDPDYAFPATADDDGNAFVVPLTPDEFVATQLWFKITVTFGSGVGEYTNVNGPYAWDTNIPVNPPATITVPTYDADGDYTVSWDAAGGASTYQLQEDTDSGFSDPTLAYDGADTNKNITGKPEGTYYYRVRAVGGSGSSDWTVGSNPCIVTPPGIRITPDLGWPSVEGMFNALLNDGLEVFAESTLIIVVDEPVDPKNRFNLVFDVDGTKYRLPAGSMGRLGGSTRHYWRWENPPTAGEIQSFTLSRSSTLTPVAQTRSGEQPSIVR